MLDEIARMLWRPMLLQISRRGAEQALQRAERLVDHATEGMREGADGDVETFGHGIDRAVDQHDVELELRILALERAEDIGEARHCQRGRGLDAEVIDEIVALLAHAREQVGGVGHHAACAMHVALPGFCEAQLPGRAVKQRRADPRLQLCDALGDDRRRDAELSRGGGEAGGVRGGEEGPQVHEDVHVDLSRFAKADRVF